MTERTIFFASDDRGVTPMLEVAVWSLLRYAGPETAYRVVILSDAISKEKQARLTALFAEQPRHTVRFFEGHDALQARAADLPHHGWPLTTWARLFMPEFLPECSGLALYLDIDVYVCEDLGPLFEAGLGDATIGCVPEKFYGDDLPTRANLGNPPKEARYVNAGVLLMDLDRWRQERVTERAAAFARRPDIHLQCADQDALNGLLAGQIRMLHPRWNFSDGWIRRAARLPIDAVWWRGLKPLEAVEAALRPGILHFWGPHKPYRCNHRPEGWRYEAALRELGLLHGALPGTTFGKRVQNVFYRLFNRLLYARLRRRLVTLRTQEQKTSQEPSHEQ